eukprot:Tamp_12978.p1 GENE.Tamp_12978~~Tamp_12978.p1  ORF type:complete len:270 (+),score=28.29 Tamp_12978:692-1501(+)
MELAGWPALESQQQVDTIHLEMSERRCPYIIDTSLRKNLQLEQRDQPMKEPSSISVLKTVMQQGDGSACELAFSSSRAAGSAPLHVSGSQNHYNFHPGNGQYQPAMVTIQHDNPPQQDFKTIVIRSCRGTGFLGASSDLSHVVALSDVPRLALLQIQDCSHCKIVVQLGQHDRLLCIELQRCCFVELAFELPYGHQALPTTIPEPDVRIQQSVCCVVDLPAIPLSFQLNSQGSACVAIRADRGDAIPVPDKTVTRVIHGEIVTKCHTSN